MKANRIRTLKANNMYTLSGKWKHFKLAVSDVFRGRKGNNTK